MNTPSKMRILVTGGAGFIGSAFIRLSLSQYSKECERIINLDALTYAANPASLSCVEGNPQYRFVHGNILDQKLVEGILEEESITHIVHCAAESHVDRSIAGPHPFVETNVMGTVSLLEAVRQHPAVHFHHVSTDEVFGALGEEGQFSEESPYRPNSPYSASKAASDHFVRAYANTYGIRTTISNCSNNFGPYQYPEKLIPVVIQRYVERKPIPIYGQGKQVRDWIYVEEHAHALWSILQKGILGETYAIGGNAEKRNIDLVRDIVRILTSLDKIAFEYGESLIQSVSERPGHDYRYALNSEKIHTSLGWRMQRPFDQSLKETVQWYVNNPKFLKVE